MSVAKFKNVCRRSTLLLLITCLFAPVAVPQSSRTRPNNGPTPAAVRAEFLHAWNGYKKYALGHDDLKPLSNGYHDWYAEPLLMTPVDAIGTSILMGLNDEATDA